MSRLRQLILGRIRPGRRESIEEQGPVQAPAPRPPRYDEIIARATAYAQAGQLSRSLSLLTEQLAHAPDNAELLYARALTLSDWGRMRESLEGLRAAEAGGLSSFGLHLNIAQLCHLLGRGEEAEQRARRAVRLDPTSVRAQLCLATVLQAAERHEEAAQIYQRAFELEPGRVECLAYIAACRLDQKDERSAEAMARKAISIDGGGRAKSWAVLGSALSRQERFDEALEAFERAEAVEARTGEPRETFVAHGFTLVSMGRVSEALGLYEQHLPLQAQPLAQAHYGVALLTAGRYREGWEQYEFRKFVPPLLLTRPTFDQPTWNGQSLPGKTLLVWAEQGVGDSVQFVRFGRLLKAQGATVILQIGNQLKDLAPDLVGFDRVIMNAGAVDASFDYHVSTMSVPRVLCPDVASIPGDVPYLNADPGRVRRWRERLGASGQLRVGLVWAGNPKHEQDRRRSIPLAKLASLFAIEGVEYFSLQKERRKEDAEHFATHARLVDLAPELDDFRETAAAIMALDLVVAVDTAVAHIAGALGKPVWLLLPAAADFRWLTGRDDSPWYPTMRLFRQQELGQWDEVVNRVAYALCNAVQRQRAGALLDALLPAKTPGEAAEPSLRSDNERPSSAASLARVAETRYGIMQYVPTPTDSARSIELYGEWLQAQVDLLGRLLPPGATILEAPSGIGSHVLALARSNGPAGHIVAYEKDPLLQRVLHQNIQANRFGAVVTVMQRELVGPAPGDESDPDTNPADDVAGMARWVEQETIDELLFERLDLIKLNEGAAVGEILEGASRTLWRLRPKLFLSVSGPGNLASITERARSFGYRCWRMESRLFRQDNFNRRDTDIFSERKAIALVAIPEESDIGMTTEGLKELPL